MATLSTPRNVPDSCPHCGAVVHSIQIDTSDDGKYREHVNGGRWCRVQYACGQQYEDSANFSRPEPFGECRRSPAFVEKARKRAKALQLLEASIKALDIDDSFRSNLLRDLPNSPLAI